MLIKKIEVCSLLFSHKQHAISEDNNSTIFNKRGGGIVCSDVYLNLEEFQKINTSMMRERES